MIFVLRMYNINVSFFGHRTRINNVYTTLDNCLLTKDLSHFAFPDVDTVKQFHEVLEHPELRGIIITQTATQQVSI